MRLFILSLLFLALPSHAERIKRDPKAVRIFRATVPCPATGKPEKGCVGYVIDHVIPLCAGGPDKPSNMQWQTVEDAKRKDREERRICSKLSRGANPLPESVYSVPASSSLDAPTPN
jgi:hypothetical protein